MSVQVRRRREAAAFLSTFVGAQGELLVDTTNNRVQVHDGATPGGWPAAVIRDLAGRNAGINTNFGINQRAFASGAALAAGAYGHDRHKAGANGCTYTFAQTVPDTTITITAGTLVQAVNALNVYNASYWLTWTGTATARAWQGTASGSFSAGAPVTIDGVTVNALLLTGLALGTITNVEFSTGTLGTTRPWQFEAALPNAGPTRFDRRHNELAICQRYYEMSYPQGTAIGANTQAGCAALFTLGGLPSYAYLAGGTVFLKTTKRVVPTVTFYSPRTGTSGKAGDYTNGADVTASVSGPGDAGFSWFGTSANASPSYNLQVHWTASAEI